MQKLLYQNQITTPLGDMEIIASAVGLRCLYFTDTHKINFKQNNFNLLDHEIIYKENNHIIQTKLELKEYFDGKREHFNVNLDLLGTDFQIKVWKSLQNIPYGKTINYLQQSKLIGKPKAVRAVANANGKNPISIILPCHRVIGSNGKLIGYAGGIYRKKFLLNLENPLSELDF